MGKQKAQPGQQQAVVEYRMSVHLGICAGPVDALLGIYVGEKLALPETVWFDSWYINMFRSELFGGIKKEGGIGGGITFLNGDRTQVLSTQLAIKLGGSPYTVPGFRGVASLFFTERITAFDGSIPPSNYTDDGGGNDFGRPGFYWSANSPILRNVWAKVTRIPKGWNMTKAAITHAGVKHANPAHIIRECLTNTEWGMGAPAAHIDNASFTYAADYLYDEDFGLSLTWTRQSSIEDFISEILDHIEGMIFISPETGKIHLKLIRDDYDVEDLVVLDPDNCTISDFQRKPPAELINEVIVSYTNPETEEDTTFTMQDLGSIAAQGAVISDTRNYYGVRWANLAQRLAARDLRTSGAPLASCTAEVDRSVWNFVPGNVVRLNWPEYGIGTMIMRVGPINYGRPGSPKIKLSLVQDIYANAVIEWDIPEDDDGSLWVPPQSVPVPPAQKQILSQPYYMVVTWANVDMTYPNAYNMVLASTTAVDTQEFELFGEMTDAVGNVTFTNIGTKDMVTHAKIGVALVPEVQTTLQLGLLWELTQGSVPTTGTFLLIGDTEAEQEIAIVESAAGGEYILRRGILDTIPRAWPLNTPVWIFTAISRVEDYLMRAVGEVVDYKILPRTSLDLYPLNDAELLQYTTLDRMHRPLRPANVVVAGVSFGTVNLTGASTVTVQWANRNRLTETATVLAWNSADTPPEAGQTTTIQLLDSDRVMFHEITGLTGTSHTFNVSLFGDEHDAYIRVISERDGFESFQGFEVKVVAASGENLPPTDIILTPVEQPTGGGGGGVGGGGVGGSEGGGPGVGGNSPPTDIILIPKG